MIRIKKDHTYSHLKISVHPGQHMALYQSKNILSKQYRNNRTITIEYNLPIVQYNAIIFNHETAIF